MEKIDRDVLDWIASHNDDAALAEQIRTAQVRKRDYMRTGFFVYLDVAAEAPLLGPLVRPQAPDIHSAELMAGAGTSLFLKGGRLHYLEIYAKGGFFPEQLRDWQLVVPD